MFFVAFSFRVPTLLTTNSDFIVNELNLCYYATRDKYTSLYKEYPLTDDQICGYEIDGKNVNPCEVTEWGGLIVESFNKEITEQNRIEDEILWGEKYKD